METDDDSVDSDSSRVVSLFENDLFVVFYHFLKIVFVCRLHHVVIFEFLEQIQLQVHYQHHFNQLNKYFFLKSSGGIEDIPVDGGKSEYAFVLASIGDVKVFHFVASSQRVFDVSAKIQIDHAKFKSEDCGGRLGRWVEGTLKNTFFSRILSC